MSEDFVAFLKLASAYALAFAGMALLIFTEQVFIGAAMLGVVSAIVLGWIVKGLIRGAVRVGVDEVKRRGK